MMTKIWEYRASMMVIYVTLRDLAKEAGFTKWNPMDFVEWGWDKELIDFDEYQSLRHFLNHN